MKDTGKWLIGIAIGVAFIFIVQLSLGGFSLYIHKAIGDVREQQRANTTLLLEYDKRLKELWELQQEMRKNDLKHMDDRLREVDRRLESIEADVKTLLGREKGW